MRRYGSFSGAVTSPPNSYRARPLSQKEGALVLVLTNLAFQLNSFTQQQKRFGKLSVIFNTISINLLPYPIMAPAPNRCPLFFGEGPCPVGVRG